MAITKVSRNLLSTGIDDQSNATAITIDSSENVMVGTTSAYGTTGTTINQAGLVYSSADGDRSGQFDRTGVSDGEIVRFTKAGATVGSIGTNAATMYVSAPQAGGMKYSFLTSTNAVMLPVTTTGANADATHDLGYDSSRFRNLYLSGGVYLGGTGAANKLDDYEEGTWTPILSFGGGTTGIGYGQQSGTYTKIGNIVCANFTIVLNSKGSSGGAAVVSALPYAVEFANHAFFIYSDRVTTTGGVVAGYISSGTSIAVYNQVSGGNSQLTNTAFANDSYISGVLTYRAA